MILLVLLCSVSIPANLGAQSEPPRISAIEVDDTVFVGHALAWDGKRFAMLARDGGLKLVDAESPRSLKRTDDPFELYTKPQLQRLLFREFGNRYDISATAHHVVVHPWGDANTWARPFETFHRSFVRYFESHGFELQQPPGPMIAVILRSRGDFSRTLINEVELLDSRIAGFYSRFTNRITTFDPAGYVRDAQDRWLYSATPVIHEATHQLAFNMGVHNRFAPPPKWLSEGLATMFEARGLHLPSRYPREIDRVNTDRLKTLRRNLNSSEFHAGFLNLIANDRLFVSHPKLAYSLSWGLSFYLSEAQPEAYFRFLREDAARPNFKAYGQQERVRDFVTAFGATDELERKLIEYYRPKPKRETAPASDGE